MTSEPKVPPKTPVVAEVIGEMEVKAEDPNVVKVVRKG